MASVMPPNRKTDTANPFFSAHFNKKQRMKSNPFINRQNN